MFVFKNGLNRIGFFVVAETNMNVRVCFFNRGGCDCIPQVFFLINCKHNHDFNPIFFKC